MDPILIWNAVALEANRVSHTDPDKKQETGPPRSARALAIVHLAMYDAYANVDQSANLPPYLTICPALPGATAQAAVAAAAYTTLAALYSAQEATFKEKLHEFGNTENPGHQLGVHIANEILADRASDPGVDPTGYQPSGQRGHYRIDPDNPNQMPHAPFYGARSKLFATQERFQLDDPPFNNGTDNNYLEALRQVRAKGIRSDLTGTLPTNLVTDPGMTPPRYPNLFETKRTPQETLIGLYWAYDGAIGLGTPPRAYNLIIRKVAKAQGNSIADNAALFAFINAAMADAGILAWEQKYLHDFWRPVTGIREHDASFGPGTRKANNSISSDTDPLWLPLGAPSTNSSREDLVQTDHVEVMDSYQCPHKVKAVVKNFTPNFPAYPSGHATFGAAAFQITRLFYEAKGKGNVTDDRDDLFKDLDFVSQEFFSGDANLKGGTQDNTGTVRPTHRRSFPDGLKQIMIENGRSRVFLGVHWVFDAFLEDANGDPDLTQNVGGVPLGIAIAKSIFGANWSGPRKSDIGPTDGTTTQAE